MKKISLRYLTEPAFILFLFVVAVVVTGCVQKPVTDYNPNRDFLALHTYAWSEKALASNQDGIVNNSLTEQRVRESVDEVLSSQNFQKVDVAKADFLVSYRLTLKETPTPSSSVGIGFGTFNPGIMLGGSVAVSQYNETELFVDMLDPHSSELIWRGSVKYPTQTGSSPETRSEEIRKRINFILSAFPPQ